MENKVLLVLIDGLRPDGLMAGSHPFLKNFISQCTYSMEGQSVFPSVTLPCHMSIFHSVTPQRHGILDNTYFRPVHKLDGLFEVLHQTGKTNYFFYTWEELRDLGRPGSIDRCELYSYNRYGKKADCKMADRTVSALKNEQPDFLFYYTGNTDEVGHKYGWMSPEYLEAVDLASENVERIVKAMPENYSLIITADHGGHDRTHGTTVAEDMTIPMLFYGKPWQAGKKLDRVSLLDIAPTVADILGCAKGLEWEGRIVK